MKKVCCKCNRLCFLFLQPHYPSDLSAKIICGIYCVYAAAQIAFSPRDTIVSVRVVDSVIDHSAADVIAVDDLEMMCAACGAKPDKKQFVIVEQALDVDHLGCSVYMRCEAV